MNLSAQPIERASGLVELVQSKRILITVGAGGVGKTTVGASIGLLGARLGRRSLVMTIDPARRLAVALGLEDLGHEEEAIPGRELDRVGVRSGYLKAMMLDQKRTFDEVIRRHAPDEQTFARIMANKLYRELSTRLAGGQEYAAIEQLYDTVQTTDADLLVLDTPPTVNAIDFLEAPKKIIELLDGPAVRMFVRSYERTGHFSFKVLAASASYVFRRLARFVGGRFLDDVAEFFGDMHSLLAGFRARAAEVVGLLARTDVCFVVVTTAEPQAVNEAIGLCERLQAGDLCLAAFVINRVHPLQTTTLAEREVYEHLVAAQLAKPRAQELAPLLLRAQRQMQALAETDEREIERLRETCGKHFPYIRVPLLNEEVHNIATLASLSDWLASPLYAEKDERPSSIRAHGVKERGPERTAG